jgi:FkbM family methyltransferase
VLLQGAAWSERGRLNLSTDTAGEWASQVSRLTEGDAGGDVEAWDVGSLIAMLGGAPVDLLKVDIEGAEREVFGEAAKGWLPKVRNICIELHGQDCQETFFNALSDFDYELELFGELTICRNVRLKTAAG